MRMSYSSWPILAVPPGWTTFCAAIALRTSAGERPLACSSFGSRFRHDGPLLAAVDVGNDGAGNGDELRPDEVQAEVVELLLGESLAGEAELKNRDGRGAELDDLRWQDAGRQLSENELRGSGDLRVRGVEARARLEVDLDDDLSGDGGRFDVLDVIDERGEDLLVGRRERGLRVPRGSGRCTARRWRRPGY